LLSILIVHIRLGVKSAFILEEVLLEVKLGFFLKI